MSRLFSLTLTALVVAGCSTGPAKNEGPGPAAAATGRTPMPERTTNSRILADKQTFEQAQLRLRKLNEAGVPQASYSLGKAQCWLDSARAQYAENDRTGYVEESLAESISIIQVLETDKTAKAGFDTPLIARSTRLREDLWAQFGQFKAQGNTLVCTGRTVACGEVRLVRAGHADQQIGWRAAVPQVQMAADAVMRARAEAASCPQPAPPLVVAKPLSYAVLVPSPDGTVGVVRISGPLGEQVLTREQQGTWLDGSGAPFTLDKLTIERDFNAALAARPPIPEHFLLYFEVGGTVLTTESKAMLKNLLQRATSVPTLDISVIGHTDTVGKSEFNDVLALSRAKSIASEFQRLDLRNMTISVDSQGKRNPLVPTPDETAEQRNRRVEVTLR